MRIFRPSLCKGSHRRLALFLLFLALATILEMVPRAFGPGTEVYTLAVSPGRIQESITQNVELLLNVTSAAVGSNYRFTFTVTDPTGVGRNALNSTTATQSSFILSVIYPRDFGPTATTKFVGSYSINVAQNQPSPKPTVATGQFQVGLTDSKTYQRTFQVIAKAYGYGPSENITINITSGGTSSPGFPKFQLADGTGSLSFLWLIPPSAATGLYTITLTGTVTTKNPSDTQTFTVFPTNITISQLTVTTSPIQRSLTQQFKLNPVYLSGVPVQSGSAPLRVTETDGTTVHSVNATYDSTLGMFRATYRVAPGSETGVWVTYIDPNSLNDGYGNVGPASGVVRGFVVHNATFTVSVSVNGQAYNAGDVIGVYANITNPDGTPVNSGTAIFSLSHGGAGIGNTVAMSYVSGQREWAGSYQVNPSDPAGIWVVSVSAQDSYGNSGLGSTSVAVTTPPSSQSPSFLNSFSFILIAVILAIAAALVLIWTLFWSRRRIARREVKIDLNMVDSEVQKIEEKDFFQRVKKQVEEKEKTPGKIEGESDSPNE